MPLWHQGVFLLLAGAAAEAWSKVTDKLAVSFNVNLQAKKFKGKNKRICGIN